MRRSISSSVTVILGACLVLALIAGGAVALTQTREAASPPPSSPQPVSSTVPGDQQTAFGVFRASAATASLPTPIRAAVSAASSLPSRYGVNADLARSIRNPVSSAPIWVLSGSQGVCLYVGNSDPAGSPGFVGSSSCASTADSKLGKLIVSEKPSSGGATSVTYGLVPDGPSAVTLTDTDGSAHAANVVSNVYVSREAHPSAVSFTDSSGAARKVPTP